LCDEHLLDEIRVTRGVHVHVGRLGVIEIAIGSEALADGAEHVAAHVVERT
jgi:hypothetical protein